jgi:ATP-dependent protease HslVU (ClpYQ) peptidase subunit
MTTIAAYIDSDGNTAIAADRRACYGMTVYSLQRSKIVKVGPWSIGVCGAEFVIGILDSLEIAGEWSPQTIADHLVETLREASRLVEGELPANLLIARRGEVWIVDDSGGAMQVDGYAAIGSGSDYAMGLMSMAHQVTEPHAGRVASMAIAAASTHDPFTDDDIDVMVLE